MCLPEKLYIPTKIHFAGLSGQDVGAVFVDCIAPHRAGFSFYFGTLCVAILTEEYLVIGPRRIERAALAGEKPFWFDARDPVDKSSPYRLTIPVLRQSA